MGQTIGVISLGCSKNRVDTEQMLALLRQAGYDFTQQPEEADLVIINTCSFIQSAKEESIETILEIAQQKKHRPQLKLLVTGCFPERYREELAKELPEVDGFMGVNQYGAVVSVVQRIFSGEKVVMFEQTQLVDESNRVLTTPSHLAYVRIAEGCDLHCTYCAIPAIRGRYRSRSMEDIYNECARLAQAGVKEIVLIAQDTSYYGKDRYGTFVLPKLLKKLGKCGAPWIRLLYTYPERITDELLDTIVRTDNVLNYLDMPLQHIDDEVLKRMGRPTSRRHVQYLLERIRSMEEDIPFTLRTTMIAGFPGETQAQHEALLSFIGEGYFDHLGAFAYSQEENTKAALLDGQLPESVKQQRAQAIMRVQRGISFKKNQQRIGQVREVLIEGYDEAEHVAFGRISAQAPEVDGLTFVQSCPADQVGTFVRCRLDQAEEYDLIGVHTDDACK